MPYNCLQMIVNACKYFFSLQVKVPKYADQSAQYFSLLCQLLNWAQSDGHFAVNNVESRLETEIEWLKKASVCVLL